MYSNNPVFGTYVRTSTNMYVIAAKITILFMFSELNADVQIFLVNSDLYKCFLLTIMHCMHAYVIRFAKTGHNSAIIEIHFIAPSCFRH